MALGKTWLNLDLFEEKIEEVYRILSTNFLIIKKN